MHRRHVVLPQPAPPLFGEILVGQKELTVRAACVEPENLPIDIVEGSSSVITADVTWTLELDALFADAYATCALAIPPYIVRARQQT